jgi:hypothetical protein
VIQFAKKLFLILLVICFCLLQIGVVYGQGVSIDFSSLTLSPSGSMIIYSHDIPSQPTQPTTTTPSTPISTNNSTTGSTTSSYQKLNNPIAGQLGYNPTDPTELTKDLIRPATFSPLSEKEPLLPDAEPYIVTVCLPFNNMSVSWCPDKVTPEQASEKLAGILLSRYFNGSEARPFRVVMPSTMPMDQQKQWLRQIEIQASAIAESRIFKADGTFIKEYDKIAREEAERGVNWSHTSKDDKSIHDFYTKKVFTKLNNIAIQEKSLSSKNFKNN